MTCTMIRSVSPEDGREEPCTCTEMFHHRKDTEHRICLDCYLAQDPDIQWEYDALDSIAVVQALSQKLLRKPWQHWWKEHQTREEVVQHYRDFVEGTDNFTGEIHVLSNDLDLAVAVTGCGRESKLHAVFLRHLSMVLPELLQVYKAHKLQEGAQK